MYKFCYLHGKPFLRITKIIDFSPKWLNLPTFLDFFCFRLATAENESNNVYFKEDEEGSEDDDGVQIKFDKVPNTQIQPTGSCFSSISLQICKGCTDVMQVAW